MSVAFSGQPVRPANVSQVNAGSACRVEYSSRDYDNVLEAPSSLRYRIDNLTDSVVIAEWTNVPTPGTGGNVTIPASTNVMSRQFRDRQLMQVTFEATYANGDKVQSMAYYELCAVLQGGAGS